MLISRAGTIPDKDTVAAQWGEALTTIDRLATVSPLLPCESKLMCRTVTAVYASADRRTDTSARGHSETSTAEYLSIEVYNRVVTVKCMSAVKVYEQCKI